MHRSAGGLLGSLAVVLTVCTPAMVAAQEPPVPVRVRLGGQAQIQFNTTSVDEEEIFPFIDPDEDTPASRCEPPPAPLSGPFAGRDSLSGPSQPAPALGDLDLADAWVNLEFDEAVQLRIGQFKKPFSLLFLTSSSLILPIERGVRIRALDLALLRDGVPLTVLDGTAVLGEEQ